MVAQQEKNESDSLTISRIYSRQIANRHDKFIKSESQRTNLLTFINMYRQLLLVKYMSFLCVSVFLSFSFFRFLVKYFQLCICIVTILLPFVVNKAYHNNDRNVYRQRKLSCKHT